VVDQQYQAYQRQYEETLQHLYELEKTFLLDAVTVDTDIEGMTKVFKSIGKLAAQKKTGRNEIANLQEPDFSARHLSISTWYCASALDMEDVIKMVNNPQADIYTEAVNAIRESQTNAVMDSFFGTVVINEDASSSSAFSSDNQVAVNFSGGTFGQNSGAADVGINIDKLLKVKSMISNNNIIVNQSMGSMLNIAVCEDDVQDLLASKIGTDNYPMLDRFNTLQLQLQSATENIVDGKFTWNGFTFHVIPPQYFDLDDSGHRRLPIWLKDGVVLGMKDNVKAEIVRLPQTVESTKIQALTRVGGMRKHDKKVYEIKAKV
jgi:hypothetical protein